MLASAVACREGYGTPYRSHDESVSKQVVSFLLMFNWAERWRKNFADSEGENAFESYLDGYFNSFDFYPVCTRKLHENSDAYALWIDFLKVARDIESVHEGMRSSPERFLALGTMSKDEIEIRKKEASEKIIEWLNSGAARRQKQSSGDPA